MKPIIHSKYSSVLLIITIVMHISIMNIFSQYSNDQFHSTVIPQNKISVTELYGEYEIFSGAQKTSTGSIFLFADNSYKVSLSHDKEIYVQGKFSFQNIQQELIWEGNFFAQNKWKGKVVRDDNNKIRILLNNYTYAVRIN